MSTGSTSGMASFKPGILLNMHHSKEVQALQPYLLGPSCLVMTHRKLTL